MKEIKGSTYLDSVSLRFDSHIKRFRKFINRSKSSSVNPHVLFTTLDLITANLVYEERIHYQADGELPLLYEILVNSKELHSTRCLVEIYKSYYKENISKEIGKDLNSLIVEGFNFVTDELVESSIRTIVRDYNDYCELKDSLDKSPIQLLCTLGSFFEISKNNEKDFLKTSCPVKTRGMVFTPYNMAAFITNKVLASYSLENKNMKILDPASGAGIFSLTILDEVSKKNGSSKLLQLAKNLYAVDIDEDSCLITRMLCGGYLYLSTDQFFDLEKNVTHGSAISDDFLENNKNTYDIVIGNPPYLKVPKKEAESYKNIFRSLKGETNYYKVFWAAAETLTKRGGVIGFVTPSDFLTEPQSTDLRKQLFVQNRLMHLYDLPLKFFPGVSLEPAITIVKKEESHRKFKFTYVYNKTSNLGISDVIKESKKVDYNSLLDTKTYSLAETFRKLSKAPQGWKIVKLKDILDIRFGFHPGSGGKYNVSSKNGLRAIEGRDVARFKITKTQKFIDLKNLSEKDISLYKNEKIIIQRIRTRKMGPDAIWIKAGYDAGGLVNLASTNGAYSKSKDIKLLVVLAMINESEFNERFKRTTNNVNITASDLGEMEIYYPTDSWVEKNIMSSVQKIIATGDESALKKLFLFIKEQQSYKQAA